MFPLHGSSKGRRYRSIRVARWRHGSDSVTIRQLRRPVDLFVPASWLSKHPSLMFRQRTIQNLVRTTGVGVHSGRRVELTLRPAAAQYGHCFPPRRPARSRRPACAGHGVGDTRMASVLQQGNVRVSTVEHLMSALAGLGIDNLHIDLTAEEVPIMDGSAATFVYLLRSAGIVEQNAPKQFIRVKKTVEVREGEGRNEKWARLEPHEGLRAGVLDRLPPPRHRFHGQFRRDRFRHALVCARDCPRAHLRFVNEVEALRSMGLARGGSLDNAIVMDEYRVLNSDGLRYDDEFVKHKILDAIGDLVSAGQTLGGALCGVQVGPRPEQPVGPRAACSARRLGTGHVRVHSERTQGVYARVVLRLTRCKASREAAQSLWRTSKWAMASASGPGATFSCNALKAARPASPKGRDSRSAGFVSVCTRPACTRTIISLRFQPPSFKRRMIRGASWRSLDA